MTGEEKKVTWTRAEDKLFEAALVKFDGVDDERWQKIAGEVSGKSPEEIRLHYEALVLDVDLIEAGRVELPDYPDDDSCSTRSSPISPASGNSKQKQSDAEKKKGTPWSEEEHRRFLIGLEKYGKGDWRSISRNVVMTRTPTQVASHAQKYFLRQSSVKKERKRTSIHDITTAGGKSTAMPVDWSSIPPHGNGVVQQPAAAPQGPLNPNHGFPV